uniref:BZIP domain-containing protein n=2 Tax=Fusarium oxysporum TaxID=5507 RepID=A0A0D2XRP4_FUSOF
MATFLQLPCSPSMGDVSSFFEEPIDMFPVPTVGGVDIPEQQPQYSAAPAQPTGPNRRWDGETLQEILLNAERGDTPVNPFRNRIQARPGSAPSKASATAVIVKSLEPRKSGRKLKKQSKGSGPTGQQEELDDDDLVKNPRQRRVLERNRATAARCRLRKRDEASALSSRERAMEDRNRYLSSCFDSLTTEIYYLKTELLRHTCCNCDLIQTYIANEARKSVDALLACSSDLAAYGCSIDPEYVGSSGTKTTGSLDSQSLRAISNSPTPTTAFYQRPKASEVRDGMLSVNLQRLPNLYEPHDSMASIRMISDVPLAGCVPGPYMSTGPQQQLTNQTGLDSLIWGFGG